MPTVISGPQRITYTGKVEGGGGSIVGPGASPSTAPVASLANGSGIESGTHDYAVTFQTGSGESLVSPRATVINVGTIDPPSSAPTVGAPSEGAGPDPGTHQYGVTFQTASGETTASPLSAQVTTTATAAPASAPSGSAIAGTEVDAGVHKYAITFVMDQERARHAVGRREVHRDRAPRPRRDVVLAVSADDSSDLRRGGVE